MPAKAGWKHVSKPQGLALSLRPLTRLAQDEEPDRACGAAGNGGGFGESGDDVFSEGPQVSPARPPFGRPGSPGGIAGLTACKAPLQS